MKECKTEPVGRHQPAAQILPARNHMYRLVPYYLFKNVGGRRPIDTTECQKATIEPRREKRLKVGIDRGQFCVQPGCFQDKLPHPHQLQGASRSHVQSTDQFMAARLRRTMQRGRCTAIRILLIGRNGAIESLGMDAELREQHGQEVMPRRLIE
jgi:hypothetical protein